MNTKRGSLLDSMNIHPPFSIKFSNGPLILISPLSDIPTRARFNNHFAEIKKEKQKNKIKLSCFLLRLLLGRREILTLELEAKMKTF